MENKSVPGSGNVIINLDGEDIKLKPGLGACLQISRMHGGTMNTIAKLREYDFDTMAQVISFGSGLGNTKELREKIYNTGMFTLNPSVIRFVTIVSNGGRPPEDTEPGDDEGGVDDDEGKLILDE